MKELFENLPGIETEEATPENAYESFIRKLFIGGGDTAVNIEKNKGVWIGARKFEDAPFSVDMLGNVVGVDRGKFNANFANRVCANIDDDKTGPQEITVGFRPTKIEIDAYYAPGLASYGGCWSKGLWTGVGSNCFFGFSSSMGRHTSNIIRIDKNISGQLDAAYVSAVSDTGFTLYWTNMYYQWPCYFLWKAWG